MIKNVFIPVLKKKINCEAIKPNVQIMVWSSFSFSFDFLISPISFSFWIEFLNS